MLPTNARQLESAREQLLTLFRVNGYELVQPPLMEYSHSCRRNMDAGLSLKPFGGRSAERSAVGHPRDITPQVARIDAHLCPPRQGINRLCYAGPMLHACGPEGLLNMREPLQAGAEMSGFADIRADIELIDLMLKSMKIADMGEVCCRWAISAYSALCPMRRI